MQGGRERIKTKTKTKTKHIAEQSNKRVMESFRQGAFSILLKYCGDWIVDFNSSQLQMLKTSFLGGKITLENIKLDASKLSSVMLRGGTMNAHPFVLRSVTVKKMFMEFNFATILDFLTKVDSRQNMKIVVEGVCIEVGLMSEEVRERRSLGLLVLDRTKATAASPGRVASRRAVLRRVR